MAVQLPQGFNIRSKEPIDKRFILTQAEMLSMNVNLMPEKYFAICSTDNKLYIFDKGGEYSTTTGYFKPYEAGTGVATKYRIAVGEANTWKLQQSTDSGSTWADVEGSTLIDFSEAMSRIEALEALNIGPRLTELEKIDKLTSEEITEVIG